MSIVTRELTDRLKSFSDKEFTIIINDKLFTIDKRSVHVSYSVAKGLKFTTTVSSEGGKYYPPVDVADLERAFAPLYKAEWYGVDFSRYLEVAPLKISINSTFSVVFLESPVLDLLKFYAKNVNSIHPSKGMITLQIFKPLNVDEELLVTLRAKWPEISDHFRFDAMDRYVMLMTSKFSRNLSTCFAKQKHTFFSATVGSDRVNFLHLFLEMPDLYNPFLDDATFQMNYGQTIIFSRTTEGCLGHKFIKDFGNFRVHCMTPRSVCETLKLKYSLNWNVERILRFLVAKCTNIPILNPRYPTSDVFFQYKGDYSSVYYELPAGANPEDYERHSYLQMFCIHPDNYTSLCRGKMGSNATETSTRLYQTLERAEFAMKGDNS